MRCSSFCSFRDTPRAAQLHLALRACLLPTDVPAVETDNKDSRQYDRIHRRDVLDRRDGAEHQWCQGQQAVGGWSEFQAEAFAELLDIPFLEEQRGELAPTTGRAPPAVVVAVRADESAKDNEDHGHSYAEVHPCNDMVEKVTGNCPERDPDDHDEVAKEYANLGVLFQAFFADIDYVYSSDL